MLVSALRHALTAVSLLAPPRKIRGIAIVNLTEIYNLAWLLTNSVTHLSGAINLQSRELESTPESDRSRHAYIIFLARLHGRCYDALRKPADLESSIKYFEEWIAIDMTPREVQGARMSNIERCDINYQLGIRLRERGDLNKAIQRFKTAVELSGDNIEVRAKAFVAIVNTIHEANPGDVKTLIAMLEMGIKVLPPSHPMVASFRKDIERVLGYQGYGNAKRWFCSF